MERREFLMTAVLSTTTGSALFGCGGSTESTAASASGWNPTPLLFLAGSTGSFDLASTLPAGVARGGTFALAPGSSPLPAQIRLSPSGVLSATAPVLGTTSNIVFTYAEPG
jgi:hypothetical protein